MNTWLLIGALAGFLGVAAGAFGAHALKAKLEPDLLAIFEVGVRYQLIHALALLILGLAGDKLPAGLLRWSGFGFTAGIIIFSGSLYLLALSGIRWFGAITPLGGLAFLAGWFMLIRAAMARG